MRTPLQAALALTLAILGGLWLSLSIAWHPPMTLFVLRNSPGHSMPPPLAWAVDMAVPAALLGIGIKLFRKSPH